MHPTTLVLERNFDQLDPTLPVLLINPPAEDDFSLFADPCVSTCDYRVYRTQSARANMKERCRFGLESLGQRFEQVVIYMPKAKAELRLILDYACCHLGEDANIFLVGEKRSGIESVAKKLVKEFEGHKIDSAKHCQLWMLQLPACPETFCLSGYFTQYAFSLSGASLTLAALPGVFSFERLDEGTGLLLESLTNGGLKNVQGRTLDFACGNGVIGLFTKVLHPEIDLEMVDSNWLALACAQKSAELNEIKARIYPSDGWSDVEGRVDAVLTNPPFHQGVDTEYLTTERFIRESKDKLTRYSPLLLVANRFLKYPDHIEHALGSCETVNQTGKFNVYLARR